MDWNKAFRLHSFAQLFSILTFVVVFTGFQSAQAGGCSTAMTTFCNDSSKTKNAADIEKCEKCSANDCDYLKRRADDKKDEFTKACKSSGQGTDSCKKKQAACDDTAGEEEFNMSESLLAALNKADTGGASKCTLYSGQGFYEEKDRIQDKLDDVNKKLKDNKKELAEINADFTKDLKKIQEDIADAQKEYQEKEADTKKAQRDRASEQAKQAAEMAQNMRKLESTILQKQQEKDDIYADKASSLGQMTEDVANSTCMDTVREAYLKRKEALKVTSQKSSTKSLIQAGGSNSNYLNMSFKQCMAKFYNARMSLIRKSDAKIYVNDKDIGYAQSEIDNLKTQLSQMSTLEQQAQQDEQTTLTQQQQALQQKIQRASSEMQSLLQTTQQKAKAVTDDSNELQTRYKQLSNQIVALGAAPAGGRASTTSAREVSIAADDYKAARDAANKASCEYYDTLFSDSGTAKAAAGKEERSGGGSTKKSKVAN